MQRSQHKDKFPEIQWNKPEPMTEEELVSLAAKCILINPEFQLHTFFNGDAWYTVGEQGMKRAGKTIAEIEDWKMREFQPFTQANTCQETNRKREGFIAWLQNRQAIHPKDFDPNQPYYEVAGNCIDALLEAIENPSPLASRVFGACDVFISHATGDTDAETLREVIESRGLSVYMTSEFSSIEQGTSWPEDLINHLKGAKMIVIVLTDKSKESPAVNQEIGFTLGSEKRYLVWFRGNTPRYILLPEHIQECPMSEWNAEKVAERIYAILNH